MSPAPASGPLVGLRVVESSLLGPVELTSFLADLGADVVKVEPPQGDYVREMTWPIVEGESLMHLHIHRGKRSVTLDLRKPNAVEAYKDLVRGAEHAVGRGGCRRRFWFAHAVSAAGRCCERSIARHAWAFGRTTDRPRSW